MKEKEGKKERKNVGFRGVRSQKCERLEADMTSREVPHRSIQPAYVDTHAITRIIIALLG